jgi:hypothetical protein
MDTVNDVFLLADVDSFENLKKLCKALHNFFYAEYIVMQSNLRKAV